MSLSTEIIAGSEPFDYEGDAALAAEIRAARVRIICLLHLAAIYTRSVH